jgi:hypothetical protein
MIGDQARGWGSLLRQGLTASALRYSLLIANCSRSLLTATVIAPVPFEPVTFRSLTHLVLHPFTFNVASVFLLSLFAFRSNTPHLFYAYDGQFEASLITLDSLFVPLQIGLTNDFIHGLGNVWFAINPKLFPECALSYSPFAHGKGLRVVARSLA